MNITNYLPEKSEYAEKVAKTLDGCKAELYIVGSAARKFLYGLKTEVKDYNVIVSNDGYWSDCIDSLHDTFPDKVTNNGPWSQVDCESFTLKIRYQPVDEFLRSVRFSGDAVAVYVPTGRAICTPEYMGLPPLVQVNEIAKDDPQNDETWLKGHVDALEKFEKEMVEQVSRELTANVAEGI